jgi:hypothetical protein
MIPYFSYQHKWFLYLPDTFYYKPPITYFIQILKCFEFERLRQPRPAHLEFALFLYTTLNNWQYFNGLIFNSCYHKKCVKDVNGIEFVIAVPPPTSQPTEVPCPEVQIPLCHDDQQVQRTVNAQGCAKFVCGKWCNLIFKFRYRSLILM